MAVAVAEGEYGSRQQILETKLVHMTRAEDELLTVHADRSKPLVRQPGYVRLTGLLERVARHHCVCRRAARNWLAHLFCEIRDAQPVPPLHLTCIMVTGYPLEDTS